MVAHEAADDAELLGVFFAEDGDVGLDDLEEFGDDGADAVEVAGAGGSAEGLGEAVSVTRMLVSGHTRRR